MLLAASQRKFQNTHRAWSDPSVQLQHDVLVRVYINRVGLQRRGPGGGTACVQFKRMLVEGTQDLPLVNGAVSNRAAPMRADGRDSPKGTVPEPEHSNLLAVDAEGPAFPDRHLL